MASRQLTVDSAKKNEFIYIFLLMPESLKRDGGSLVVALASAAVAVAALQRRLGTVMAAAARQR